MKNQIYAENKTIHPGNLLIKILFHPFFAYNLKKITTKNV